MLSIRRIACLARACVLVATFLPFACGAQADTVSISGKVTDTDGMPVDRLSIHVMEPGGRLVRAAFTSSDGRYIVDRLARGKVYEVAVASVSQELGRRTGIPGGTTNIDMQVSLRKLRGQVTLPDGSPAATASVVAISLDWALERTTIADQQGKFELTQLPPTIWEVSAKADKFREKTARIDLNKSTDELRLKLDPNATVEVTVTEATSQRPLPNVDVSIGENIAGTLRYRYLGQTDAQGRLTDLNAIPGRAMLMVASPLHQEPPVPIEVATGAPTRATLRADRSGTLEGDLSQYQASAVKKVSVLAEPLGPMPNFGAGAYTGVYSPGRFSIGVPPGRYKVHVVIEFEPPPTRSLLATTSSIVLESNAVSVPRGKKVVVQVKPRNR